MAEDGKTLRADEIEQAAYRAAHSLLSKFAAMNTRHYQRYPELLSPSRRPNYTQCGQHLTSTLTRLFSRGLVVLPPEESPYSKGQENPYTAGNGRSWDLSTEKGWLQQDT